MGRLTALTLCMIFSILGQPSGHAQPAPAVTAEATGPAAFTAFWVDSLPLAQYLNGTDLDPDTLLYNISIRYVGRNVTDPSLMTTMLKILRGLSESFYAGFNATVELYSQPAFAAPVIWLNVTDNTADGGPAPDAPELQAGGLEDYAAIEVVQPVLGDGNSKVMNTKAAAPMGSYIDTLLHSHGILVENVSTNLSTSSAVLPIFKRMPFGPTYILCTIIEMTGPKPAPVRVEMETLLLMAVKDIVVSYPRCLSGRIQSVYSDGMAARFAHFLYTSQATASIYEVGGRDVPAAIAKRAAAVGLDLSAKILSSIALGTQDEELIGDPKFTQQRASLPIPFVDAGNSSSGGAVPHGSGRLSDGALTGLIIGGTVFGLSIVCGTLIGVSLIYQRVRLSRSRILDDKIIVEPEDGKGPPSHEWMGGCSQAKKNGNSEGSSSIPTKGSDDSGLDYLPDVMPSPTQLLKEGAASPQLSEAWTIAPSDLQICLREDGSDWLLGAGSFGRVYKGKRSGIQDVAIKVVNPGVLQLRMFKKELAVLRHLNLDKNLVQFYGACLASDNLMLVLEFMEGGDLMDAIGNDSARALGWYGRGTSILMDVARGLHFLHSNRVAHRDLKTKNILLTAKGDAKIGDVGLARLSTSQALSTQINSPGTFAYAAPEVLIGGHCNHQVDIYSFGVLMWEVVTHDVPMRGNLRKIKIPEEGPQEVEDLIQWCLQPEPSDRPTARQIFSVIQAMVLNMASSSRHSANALEAMSAAQPLT